MSSSSRSSLYTVPLPASLVLLMDQRRANCCPDPLSTLPDSHTQSMVPSTTSLLASPRPRPNPLSAPRLFVSNSPSGGNKNPQMKINTIIPW